MAFVQPSPSSSLTSRESFLEKKILILDKRLTNVEKFIESRFRSIEANTSCDSRGKEDKPRSRAKGKESKKTTKDVAIVDLADVESPENLASTSSHSQTEGSQSNECQSSPTTGPTKKRKKNRPGPASVKKKREEESADKKALKQENLKDCVVLLTKSDIPTPVTRADDTDNKVDIVKTSSGRARKTPKRYEEDNYEDIGTPKRSKKCSKGKKLGDDGVKNEKGDEEVEGEKATGSETPVAIIFDHGGEEGEPGEDNGQGNYDSYFDVDGPNSPPGDDREDDGEEEEGRGETREGNYFTFLKSPPRSTVTAVGARVKEDDEDWDAEGDHDHSDEDDDDGDGGEVETPEENPPVKRGRGRPRGTKGRFKKIKKVKKPVKKPAEGIVKKVRKFVSVPLAEVPTEMLASPGHSVKLCELCKKHIKNELYENHLESHAKERHLKCTQCDKAYFNTYMLKKHMRVHEPEKYAKKCRQCGKQFIQMDKLLAHERFCVKRALEKNQFVDPNLIEDLKKRSKGNPSWIEEVEGMGEDTTSTTNSNTPGPSSPERKQCPHCNKNFKADFFEKHLRVHNKEKSWSCKECDKSYHYKHDLVRHVTLEHVADAKCEFCGETFADRKVLKEHRTPCRRIYRKEELKIREVTSLVKKEEKKNEKEEEEEMVEEEDNNYSRTQDTEVMEVEVGETIVGGPIVIEEVSIVDDDYEDEEGTHHITLGLVTAGD